MLYLFTLPPFVSVCVLSQADAKRKNKNKKTATTDFVAMA